MEAWLKNRPLNTRRQFALRLMHFSKDLDMDPEKWRKLDRFEARDILWKYVQPFLGEHSSVGVSILKSLKSWYRNLNGEKLPFDSGRGGKHYLRVRRLKLAKEHIPTKLEMYQIVDMTGNLRDRAVLMFLFHSGVRVNVIEHIKYGDVADQLNRDPITLKITDSQDHKLRGYDIPFYYTFLTGEAVTTLREYCKHKHKRGIRDRPLFGTSGKKAVSQKWVWMFFKAAAEKAGFDRDSMTTHTIRKAFRKIGAKAGIPEEELQQLMGHVLRGSRENYYDRKDIGAIQKSYSKLDFVREVPESEVTKLLRRLETEESKSSGYKTELQDMKQRFLNLEKRVEELLKQKSATP